MIEREYNKNITPEEIVGHSLRGRELIHSFLNEMRTDLKNSCNVQDYWDHELI